MNARRIVRTSLTLLLVAGAAAYAAVPNTFTARDPLSARTMNENFAALDARIASVEAARPKVCVGSFLATKGVGCTVQNAATSCFAACRFVDASGGGAAEVDIRAGVFGKPPECVASPSSVDGTWVSASGDSATAASVRFGPTTGVGIHMICVEP